MESILGVKDWSKFNASDPQHTARLISLLTKYATAGDIPTVRAAMQHFVTKGDFPANASDLIAKYRIDEPFDNGWEFFLDVKDFTEDNGPYTESFTIADVADGVSFDQIEEGEAVEVKKIAGSVVSVGYLMYAAGLAWPFTLFKDRNYYRIEENAQTFRNRYLQKVASLGYALVQALPSGQDVAWQVPTPSALPATDANYDASRDAATINAACLGILTDLKDKGYGVSANSQFELGAPLALRVRLLRALQYMQSSPLTTGLLAGISFNVRPHFSLEYTSNGTYYVGIGGNKNIMGVRENLALYDDFDVLTRSSVATGWFRRNGALGDVEQIARCATS